jgi:Nuclease-related domain
VAQLIALAYDSDAMRAGLTEPRLRVFPNGQFFASGEFYETVLLPYHSGHFAERFEENIRRYSDLYEASQSVGRPVEDVFDRTFITAFEAEYGVPLQQLVRIAQVLEQHAVENKKIVVKMAVSTMKGSLASQLGLTAIEINAFFKNFCFFPRARWDFAPPGFVNKDWYPWRFRRRLSLMARPIVLTGFSESDELFYAPGLVHDAFASLVVGSSRGVFDPEYFSTAEMRARTGAINNKEGHEFNERVAEEFRKLNFKARASVQMTEFNVSPEIGDLGDIDVLAWSPTGLVYVTECKNLRFAMTVGEVVDQLNRFRGGADDDLHKHLRRCQWLSQNLHRLAQVIGQNGSVKIEPLLVSNTIVPMQFSQGLPIPTDNILPIGALQKRIPLP